MFRRRVKELAGHSQGAEVRLESETTTLRVYLISEEAIYCNRQEVMASPIKRIVNKSCHSYTHYITTIRFVFYKVYDSKQ